MDASLLNEILKLKGLMKPSATDGPERPDNAKVIRLTGLESSLCSRALAGQELGADALGKLANGLELDGNFLLNVGHRFVDLDLPHALSEMALDRYCETHDLEQYGEVLRYIAKKHGDPPMWSTVWEQIHTSLKLADDWSGIPKRPGASRTELPRQSRTARSRGARRV